MSAGMQHRQARSQLEPAMVKPLQYRSAYFSTHYIRLAMEFEEIKT